MIKTLKLLLANKLMGFHIFEEINKTREESLAANFTTRFFDSFDELIGEGTIKEANIHGATMNSTEDGWYEVRYYVKVTR